MKLKSTFLFLILSLSYSGQIDTVFFDKNWKPCQKKSAKYYRTINIVGSKYLVTDFYINNVIQMKTFSSRKDTLIKDGNCTFYNELGLLTDQGDYINNTETGIWTFNKYSKNGGKYCSGFYLNGLLDSTLTYYYPSGKIKSISRFKNDTLNGLLIKYRKDGSTSSTANYLNGKLNGWYIEYFVNGNKHYEEEYKIGKSTGNRRLYFKNGQLQGEYYWTERRVNGYEIWYYENGDIQSKVIFTNGKRRKTVRAGIPLE